MFHPTVGHYDFRCMQPPTGYPTDDTRSIPGVSEGAATNGYLDDKTQLD